MARRPLAALTRAAATRTLRAPLAASLARKNRFATTAALALAAAALAPTVASAQGMGMGLGLGNVGPDLPAFEVPDGSASVLTATVSQSIEANTNYRLDRDSPGTSYYGDTRLALDLLKRTDTQTFGAGIDTGFRPLWEADESTDVVVASPSTAYLTFDQEGANTAFDSNFRLRSSEVDDDIITFDVDNPVPTPLDGIGTARQTRIDGNVGFVLGSNDPSSYEFRVRGTSIDYSSVDDGVNVTPRDSLSGEVTWNLDVSPVLSTVVSARYGYSATDDGLSTEVRTTSLDAGLAYERSETFRIRGGIGYADRERKQDISFTNSNRTTESNSGPLLRTDMRYITENVTFLANAEYTTAAPQNRLSGNLGAIYRLPRAQLAGQVFQNYSNGSGGDDQRITGAGIGITQEINTVSSIGLNAAWAEQVDLEGPDNSIKRTTLTARYTHEITEAVMAQVGYSYRSRNQDGTADSNEVFLVIGRTFVTGF
ncbi:hypothetical protein HNP73_004376 [Amaricoccus macauensis]|uniref:TIGR03016 family PEP-CTERM system-associated outer membrane protein n=1 Tax=Amaricoccus macauensis TaxID=57001 RepID=A0A840SX75_9RHOB|nr:hypothetical protein [Amaricoccus macauensis]MBB5224406.1 hypothetical protein [Amaricoccus macauensis]